MSIRTRGREWYEMSREAFYEQFRPEPGLDAEGYYPGEKQWRAEHAAEVAKREKQAEREFKRSLKALLDEAERG